MTSKRETSPIEATYGGKTPRVSIDVEENGAGLVIVTRPAPLPKEGGSSYETHHTVVGQHGPNPVGGKRGCPGCNQDRHRWSRHFEGDQRGRQPPGQGRQ